MTASDPQNRPVPSTLKVAVTGGAASGKTSVCRHLKALGLPVISADDIAHQVVFPGSPVYQAIVARFGSRVVLTDGTLDRKRLREVVFSDEKERHALEKIIHPAILEQMDRSMEAVERAGSAVVLVEVPLLFELDLADRFHLVVTVTADPKRRVERLMRRDGVSREAAEAVLRSQVSDDEKISKSDFVITNDGTQEGLTAQVDRLYWRLNEKISKFS